MMHYSRPMKLDALKQFSQLRNTLLQERADLEDRLARISELLGPAATPNRVGLSVSVAGSRTRKGRRRGGLSLREAILRVTAARPLTKEEILDAVKKLGYKFSTSKPIGSINWCLYQTGAFVRKDKRFGPKKGA